MREVKQSVALVQKDIAHINETMSAHAKVDEKLEASVDAIRTSVHNLEIAHERTQTDISWMKRFGWWAWGIVVAGLSVGGQFAVARFTG